MTNPYVEDVLKPRLGLTEAEVGNAWDPQHDERSRGGCGSGDGTIRIHQQDGVRVTRYWHKDECVAEVFDPVDGADEDD